MAVKVVLVRDAHRSKIEPSEASQCSGLALLLWRGDVGLQS